MNLSCIGRLLGPGDTSRTEIEEMQLPETFVSRG